MLGDKKGKKKYLKGKNYQEDLQQENCFVSQIRGTMRNIGQDWKEIGNVGRKVK